MSKPELVIVSDLHVGGGQAASSWGSGFRDEFAADEALGAFLQWLGARRAPRLVLLGDTFDFLRVPVTGSRTGMVARDDAEAVAQLDSIVAAHPAVFAGLSDVLGSGVQIDLVCGNHDAELVRPAVRQRLCTVLGGEVAFHPWILYLPGTLYAEHGHQHHDINRLVCPLYPYAGDSGRLERPPAALLGDLTRWPSRPGLLWRDALSGLRPHPSARKSAGYRTILSVVAEEIGLPEAVTAELHDLSRSSLARTARRVVGARLRRRVVPSYLTLAAASVHDLLTRSGLGVPYYAFGHTHVATRLPLDSGAWYLNGGTWSDAARGKIGARRTWIEVTEGAGGALPAARLFRWADGPQPLADDARPASITTSALHSIG